MILITGCAGFIGSHLCEYLLKKKFYVVGIDNINDYYNVDIKIDNLVILEKYKNFKFYKEDTVNTKLINELKPEIVVHLASLAGVRNSINNMSQYAENNILSQINLLEQCKDIKIEKYIYASSSSVYGLNENVPFNESDIILKQNSPYATTKVCLENYANMFNTLYGVNTIGLRFFTVYGPRGRPDMAPYIFLNSINKKMKFNKFGTGESYRDYTYIDDIVEGIYKLIISKNTNLSRIYNLGNSNPITLNKFIETCEKVTSKKAIYNQIGNQQGDVPHTYSNISLAKKDFDYNPKVSLEEGLALTYKWIINK